MFVGKGLEVDEIIECEASELCVHVACSTVETHKHKRDNGNVLVLIVVKLYFIP